MHVRIDQSGEKAAALQVENLGRRSSERSDLVEGSDCQDATVTDRHGLGPDMAWVHREDRAATDDQIGDPRWRGTQASPRLVSASVSVPVAAGSAVVRVHLLREESDATTRFTHGSDRTAVAPPAVHGSLIGLSAVSGPSCSVGVPGGTAGTLGIMDAHTLGGIGIWSSGLRYGDSGASADAASELDELGFEAIWLPDVGGHLFEVCENLLGATRRTVIATGILNLWFHDALETTERFHALTGAHGDRFLVGIGVSHQVLVEGAKVGTYERPYTRMVSYLDALDAQTRPVPVSSRLLAALGPRMIRLAGERAAGTHPYLGTPDLTRRTRIALGEGPVVAPEQAVVLETDPERARRIARAHLAGYLGLPNYARSILRAGFDEEDLSDGGSNRLVDRLVAWGDEAAIAERVTEHRDAGATHVCLQVLGEDQFALPRDDWRRLAVALV